MTATEHEAMAKKHDILATQAFRKMNENCEDANEYERYESVFMDHMEYAYQHNEQAFELTNK